MAMFMSVLRTMTRSNAFSSFVCFCSDRECLQQHRQTAWNVLSGTVFVMACHLCRRHEGKGYTRIEKPCLWFLFVWGFFCLEGWDSVPEDSSLSQGCARIWRRVEKPCILINWKRFIREVNHVKIRFFHLLASITTKLNALQKLC